MPRHPRRIKRILDRESHFATGQRWEEPSAAPPNDLPIYRLITDRDVEGLSKSVSEALRIGYQLYGSPILSANGTEVILAQAVLWPVFDDGSPIDHEDDEIPF